MAAGIATSAGVESTARRAYELDSDASLAVDATTGTIWTLTSTASRRFSSKPGEAGTTQQIIALLDDIRIFTRELVNNLHKHEPQNRADYRRQRQLLHAKSLFSP